MIDAGRNPDGLLRHLMAERTPAERLRMCTRMFSSARALAVAGLQSIGRYAEGPDLRREIFLRFYGTDFSERQREAILEAIVGSRSS